MPLRTDSNAKINSFFSVILSLLKTSTSPNLRAPGRYDEWQILMKPMVWPEVLGLSTLYKFSSEIGVSGANFLSTIYSRH